MAKYTFKYWFEWGCSMDMCSCLWANDAFTKDKFGYDVDLFKLPISRELVQFLCELGIEHDKALDWEYPPDPLLWTKEEEERFYHKAKEGYNRLVEELEEDYEILYCEDK